MGAVRRLGPQEEGWADWGRALPPGRQGAAAGGGTEAARDGAAATGRGVVVCPPELKGRTVAVAGRETLPLIWMRSAIAL